MKATPIGSIGEWFPNEDYPADAVAAGRAGNVVAKLGLDSTGAVVSCDVSRSSGTASLDRKTCELALARGKFEAARDKKGRPMASIFTINVRWLTPETSSGRPNAIDVGTGIDVGSEFEWVIGGDGIVESCKMISPHLNGLDDGCLRFPPGSQWGAYYSRDGQPVRALVRDRFSRTAHVVTLPR